MVPAAGAVDLTTPPLPRHQFPVADRFRYLNHARVCAPPTVVAHALARDASAATMLGTASQAARTERVEDVRARCAELLGTSADDVSLTRSTTEGMALLASGLPWTPGDQVLVPDREHPLTLAPWEALAPLGVEVVRVPVADGTWALDPDAVDAALVAAGGRVRVVVAAWVHHARGARRDLAALAATAHAHGALLVADVIQGVGVVPAALDAWGVDASVAGGQKWLLGPEGVGLVHTTAAVRDRLRIAGPGWTTIVDDGDGRFHHDPRLDRSGRRYEGGTRGLGAIGGLGASTELLAGAGIDAVWAHVDAWLDRFVVGLDELGATVVSDRSPSGRSAIVSATFTETGPGGTEAPVDPTVLVDRLVSRGVLATAWSGAVRFSPHGWNDRDDLDATLDALRRALRR